MFPDLDDPHTLPAATPQQREAVRQRGTRLRRRRRALQSAVPAGLALAAVALFATLNSPFSDSAPDPAQPAGPSPQASEATGWPETVDTSGSLELTDAPLPAGGIDLAVVQSGESGPSRSSLFVVAGEWVRRAASGTMFVSPALSPDGRLLAYTTGPYGGDYLAVVEATTGRLLLEDVIRTTSGDPGQTRVLEWSADGSVLVHAVAITPRSEADVLDHIRAYRIDKGQVALGVVGEWNTIPGDYIGVSPDGSRLAAVSGGQVAWSDVGSTTWKKSGLAVPTPAVAPTGRPVDFGPLSQNRWSPDGRWLAWVVTDPDQGTRSLVAADTATGEWSQRPLPRDAEFLGWHGDQAVVSTSSVSNSGLVAEVSLVDPDGGTRVISSARVGPEGWASPEGWVVGEGWVGSVALNRLP